MQRTLDHVLSSDLRGRSNGRRGQHPLPIRYRKSAGRAEGFSKMMEPITKVSIDDLRNVLIASSVVYTMGSSERLNEVFTTAGTPVN